MNTIRLSPRAFPVAALALVFAACSDAPAGPGVDEPRLEIITDAATLASMVRLTNGRELPIESVEGRASLSARATAAATAPFALALQAEVTPPVVGGRTLEATHLVVEQDYAYVSYGASGDDFAGAVVVFDIRTRTNPRVVSMALLPRVDVNAIAVSAGRVYLAEARGDSAFSDRAALEVIEVRSGVLQPSSRRVPVPSYAATGVSIYGNLIFVTSGTGGPRQGGVTVIDRARLVVLGTDPFADARALEVSQTEEVAIAFQGTPGRLRVYDARTGTLRISELAVGGGGIAASKGDLETMRDWVYVAAGDGGVKVVSLARRAVIDSLARPVDASVEPADAVSNAVTVDADLVLVANGGAGVYVASQQGTGSSTGRPNLSLLGRIRFDGPVSANFVGSRNGVLFVASGLGGLKIISVTR